MSLSTSDEQLARALKIAFSAHRGQPSKDDRPYLYHPMRLADRASTDDERIVALLHDTVEDSDVTLDSLRADGFPDHIVRAVDHLTKRDGESYDAFIDRVLEDPLAARIKLLDLEDNMDLGRLAEVTQKDLDRAEKYRLARERILAKLG